MTEHELESMRHHLDGVAGAQLAMNTALKLLLTPYRANAQAEQALRMELERVKADLLGSPFASEEKQRGFDEAAEALLATVAPTPEGEPPTGS